MKLNLGSGYNILKDFTNVDMENISGVEVITDLRNPWPWMDSSIEYILAKHIIEHLPDKIFTMNEAYRVLEPGGIFHIIVPTTNGMGAWQDPTHVSFWNLNSFKYYEKGSPYRESLARSNEVKAKFYDEQHRLYEDQTWKDGETLEIVLRAAKE